MNVCLLVAQGRRGWRWGLKMRGGLAVCSVRGVLAGCVGRQGHGQSGSLKVGLKTLS